LLTTSALIKVSKAWRGRERCTLRICRSAEKHALTVAVTCVFIVTSASRYTYIFF